MPIAAHIAAVIGSPIFDPPGHEEENGFDYHGDFHRWLVLDFICGVIPHSPFVAFLVEAAGASSVSALRAAVRVPASYALDFRLAGAWDCALGVSPLELRLADFHKA